MLYDNLLNVNCFCLMHFNMKVLKLERGRCSAVYRALLYFVLKLVLALREKEPQLTSAIAINHSHSGLCKYKLNSAGQKLSLDLGV